MSALEWKRLGPHLAEARSGKVTYVVERNTEALLAGLLRYDVVMLRPALGTMTLVTYDCQTVEGAMVAGDIYALALDWRADLARDHESTEDTPGLREWIANGLASAGFEPMGPLVERVAGIISGKEDQ